MPFVIGGSRRPRRVLAAAAAALLVGAPAAQAKSSAANARACTAEPAFAQPFTAWSDFNVYTLVAGGDMESALTGWTLRGGAGVVEGNAPFAIGGASDHRSLSLPARSSAVTAPICIDATYPHLRMFALRQSGGGPLKVDVLSVDVKGRFVTKSSSSYAGETGAWSLTDELDIKVKFDSSMAAGAAPVAFRITVPKGTSWRIDDIYVDPRMRG